MSLAAVVKKDFRDGMRSKLLWTLMAVFVLVIGGFSLIVARDGGEAGGGTELMAFMGISVVLAILFLIPITGLVVSIKSIVREREQGSIKILLSLPHTRGEVVLGKFIGRSGLLTVAVLAGFLPATIVLAVAIDDLPLMAFLAFIVVMIMFGIVFVAVGIGMSALTNSETQATIGGIGLFLLMFLWSSIYSWINSQFDLLSGNADLFVHRFYLLNIFTDVLNAFESLRDSDIPNASIVAYNSGFAQNPETGELVIESQPFYLQHWFAFVLLAAWIVVPLAIGYWRFENRDL